MSTRNLQSANAISKGRNLKKGWFDPDNVHGRSVRRQHDDQPHACTHVLHSRSPAVAFPRAPPHRSVCCNQPRRKAKHPPQHKLGDAHGCLVHVANSEASRDGRKQRINAWSNAMASSVACKHQWDTLQPSRADADADERWRHACTLQIPKAPCFVQTPLPRIGSVLQPGAAQESFGSCCVHCYTAGGWGRMLACV